MDTRTEKRSYLNSFQFNVDSTRFKYIRHYQNKPPQIWFIYHFCIRHICFHPKHEHLYTFKASWDTSNYIFDFIHITTYSPARQRWRYTLVNFHWARVRFGTVPLVSSENGSGVNSPAAVFFTVLSQTTRRPSYFQNSTIAWAVLRYFGYRIASKSKKVY